MVAALSLARSSSLMTHILQACIINTDSHRKIDISQGRSEERRVGERV